MWMTPLFGGSTFSSDDTRLEIDFIVPAPGTFWRVPEVRVVDKRRTSDRRPVLAVLEWNGGESR